MDSIKYNKLGKRLSANLSDSLHKLKRNLKLLPPRKTTSKQRRTVSFAPPSENKIYEVPHINDYSSELIGAIWYSDVDYHRIEKSCAKIIRKMNSDKPIQKMKNKYCQRGLEKFTDVVAPARQIIRKRAIYAVLDEQEWQWRDDVFEPAGIADIYAEHCLVSKIDAINTARRDELESKRCTKKKIDAATTAIKKSQKDKLNVHVHDRTPLHSKLQRNSSAPPQA
jgi:hypothetical protein